MTNTVTEPTTRQAKQNRGLWAIQILLALVFYAAGGQKLLGTDSMVALFDQIGAGQEFRYVTGGVEILAAALIVIPMTAFTGAALIICIMVGAAFTHAVLIGGSAIPALVLFCLAGLVAWGRKPS